MSDGVGELENWLHDLIDQGLATVEQLPSEFWEEFASRMVDAKLGGIGRRIRQLNALLSLEKWHELLLRELAELHLFVQAFKKMPQLSEAMQQDVLQVAGVNVKKDEVLKQVGYQDQWLVIGQQSGTEENLTFRRTWLWGATGGRAALLLDFTWGRNPFPVEWIVGTVVIGEIVYYPGAFPQRALIRRFQLSKEPFDGLSGYEFLEAMQGKYAEALAANPWLRNFPCLLESVTPVYSKGEFLLVDQQKKQLPFSGAEDQKWKLMALSTGQPIHVFGEWNGQRFLPLSIISNNRIVSLS